MKRIEILKLLNNKKKRLDKIVLTRSLQSKTIKKLAKEVDDLQNKLMQ